MAIRAVGHEGWEYARATAIQTEGNRGVMAFNRYSNPFGLGEYRLSLLRDPDTYIKSEMARQRRERAKQEADRETKRRMAIAATRRPLVPVQGLDSPLCPGVLCFSGGISHRHRWGGPPTMETRPKKSGFGGFKTKVVEGQPKCGLLQVFSCPRWMFGNPLMEPPEVPAPVLVETSVNGTSIGEMVDIKIASHWFGPIPQHDGPDGHHRRR